MTKQQTLNKEDYDFPKWITLEMKKNFYSMWHCFGRTTKNYYENELTKLNNKKVIGKTIIQNKVVKGEYWHKWNNIGWVFKNKKVYTVSNVEILKKK